MWFQCSQESFVCDASKGRQESVCDRDAVRFTLTSFPRAFDRLPQTSAERDGDDQSSFVNERVRWPMRTGEVAAKTGSPSRLVDIPNSRRGMPPNRQPREEIRRAEYMRLARSFRRAASKVFFQALQVS